jgi:hypothetical protein
MRRHGDRGVEIGVPTLRVEGWMVIDSGLKMADLVHPPLGAIDIAQSDRDGSDPITGSFLQVFHPSTYMIGQALCNGPVRGRYLGPHHDNRTQVNVFMG